MPAWISVVDARPEMTRGEEDLWRDLVERRCGNFFSDSRLHVLRNCLWQGMRARGISSYREYYELVAHDSQEWRCVLDRVVNRETSFFRHIASYSALADQLLPLIARQRRSQGDGRIALWSAGCSTGEEPYSLAITALESLDPAVWSVQVTASDVSAAALDAARAARYNERAASAIPAPLLTKYFTRHGPGYELNAAVRSLVSVSSFNFVEPASYPLEMQDIIFCQNVFIYFREPLRLEIAGRLAARLRPGGFLLAAPGELAGLRIPGLETLRLEHTTVLRKEPLCPGAA